MPEEEGEEYEEPRTYGNLQPDLGVPVSASQTQEIQELDCLSVVDEGELEKRASEDPDMGSSDDIDRSFLD